MKNYEAPEIVDLGDARRLTLGSLCHPLIDGCDCLKRCDHDITFTL